MRRKALSKRWVGSDDLMEPSTLPTVSIIIPVKPGGRVGALEAVGRLDYPPEKIEVFVSEGNCPSKQRNEAAKVSTGEILYFLDDDSRPSAGNLKSMAEHFMDPAAAVVGGPSLTPESDSFLQHCFEELLCSPFGGGGVRNRYRKTGRVRDTSERELILCNLAFRAGVYHSLGGLDERLYPNEENHLMARIRDKGYRLIHDPDIFVFRSQRETLPAFIRQMLNYGRGRMEQTILRPASFSLPHFVPLFFLLYCASLIFITSPYYLLPLAVYAFLVLFFALWGASSGNRGGAESMKKFPVLALLFPVMHLCYGAGMLWGAVKTFMLRRGSGVVSPVTVRKVM